MHEKGLGLGWVLGLGLGLKIVSGCKVNLLAPLVPSLASSGETAYPHWYL